MSRKNGKKNKWRVQRREFSTIYLSTEGGVTEPGYFKHIQSLNKDGKYVFCLPRGRHKHKTDPVQVLDRMKKLLTEAELFHFQAFSAQ